MGLQGEQVSATTRDWSEVLELLARAVRQTPSRTNPSRPHNEGFALKSGLSWNILPGLWI
jgi:hypothetical protein